MIGLTSTIELECVDNVEIVTPLLLPQRQTAIEVVPLQLLTHEVILINHHPPWLEIGNPIFACKGILIGKLDVLLGRFLRAGHGRGEGDHLSVLREGEMLKRHKVLVILGVQSSSRDQVT